MGNQHVLRNVPAGLVCVRGRLLTLVQPGFTSPIFVSVELSTTPNNDTTTTNLTIKAHKDSIFCSR